MDVEQALQLGHDGFDAVIARGFGPPDVTLSFAARLVRPGGYVVISEPPDDVGANDRWDATLLNDVNVVRRATVPHMACFQRRVD